MLSVDDVVKACITILDTAPDVLVRESSKETKLEQWCRYMYTECDILLNFMAFQISELTIMPIHQVTKRMPQPQ